MLGFTAWPCEFTVSGVPWLAIGTTVDMMTKTYKSFTPRSPYIASNMNQTATDRKPAVWSPYIHKHRQNVLTELWYDALGNNVRHSKNKSKPHDNWQT